MTRMSFMEREREREREWPKQTDPIDCNHTLVSHSSLNIERQERAKSCREFAICCLTPFSFTFPGKEINPILGRNRKACSLSSLSCQSAFDSSTQLSLQKSFVSFPFPLKRVIVADNVVLSEDEQQHKRSKGSRLSLLPWCPLNYPPGRGVNHLDLNVKGINGLNSLEKTHWLTGIIEWKTARHLSSWQSSLTLYCLVLIVIFSGRMSCSTCIIVTLFFERESINSTFFPEKCVAEAMLMMTFLMMYRNKTP